MPRDRALRGSLFDNSGQRIDNEGKAEPVVDDAAELSVGLASSSWPCLIEMMRWSLLRDVRAMTTSRRYHGFVGKPGAAIPLRARLEFVLPPQGHEITP